MLTASNTVSIVRRYPSNPEMVSRPSNQCPRKKGRRFVARNVSASLHLSDDSKRNFDANCQKGDALTTASSEYADLEIDDPVQVGNLSKVK
jgi:hypothetical protein